MVTDADLDPARRRPRHRDQRRRRRARHDDPVRPRHARLLRTDRGGPRLDGHARRGRGAGARLRPPPRPRAAKRRRCAATRSPPTAASSPGTCRSLDEYLHYRMIDVSSIKELAKRWYPRVYQSQPRQGPGAPRARRHPREHPGAGLLPAAPCSSPPPGPDAGRGAGRGRGGSGDGRGPGRLTRLRRARPAARGMVGVAQLVEHLVVVQDVAGSSPVTHPEGLTSQMGSRMVEVQRLSAADAVRMVAELASDLADTPSLDDLLDRAVGLAVDIVPGCEQAGISLLQNHVVDSPSSVGPLAATCDKLQERLGEGPCITALLEADVIRIDDISTDPRWPRFAEAAAVEGVRSMLACRLATQRDKLGALNMYSDRDGRVQRRVGGDGRRLRSACEPGAVSPRPRDQPAARPAEPRGHRPGDGDPDGTSPDHGQPGLRRHGARVATQQRQAAHDRGRTRAHRARCRRPERPAVRRSRSGSRAPTAAGWRRPERRRFSTELSTPVRISVPRAASNCSCARAIATVAASDNERTPPRLQAQEPAPGAHVAADHLAREPPRRRCRGHR